MARPGTKAVVITIAALLLLGAGAVALSFAARLVAVGTAYTAKMLCSEVFVAGRDAAAVRAELAVDDLAVLRAMDASVDPLTKAATASLYGLAEGKARYRDGVGCAFTADPPVAGSWEAGARIAAGDAKHRPLGGDVQPLESAQTRGALNRRLSAALDDAFSEPDPARPRRTRAVVVLHHGHIVGERYAADVGPHTPMLGWSLTKSVMNALVGVLVKQGRLARDTPVLMEAWRAPGDPRRRIRVEHLLQMSSGLEFNEDMADPLADVSRMLLRERDMAAFAADKALVAEPGSRWQYSSGNTNILAGFLRSALGDGAYYRFPREALFDRLGMGAAVLEADVSGTFVGSSYMYATAREWARFGLLYLQDGVWGGERVLPEGWVRYTRTPAPADPQRAYGAHFWLRIPQEYRRGDGGVPDDAFHAVGHEGQFVTIVPSHAAVIVRLGRTRYPHAWEHDVFVRNVLAALPAET
jgi:CubicO group peptidase (beta-lactamase class C family)